MFTLFPLFFVTNSWRLKIDNSRRSAPDETRRRPEVSYIVDGVI